VAEVLLAAEDLGKTYGTTVKTVALSDVSFELRAAEFAAVIGQSGSGKSTLLNLIGLLDTPTSGTVTLNGHDTAAATRKQRAALRNDLIGFVFQFHYLLPEFSVLDNVLMPGRIAGASVAKLKPRAEEVLALLGLEGLESKGANDLSGGQKQRVAIARALMNREHQGGLRALPAHQPGAPHSVRDRDPRSRRGAADRPHPRSPGRPPAPGRAQRLSRPGAGRRPVACA
jgi:lipoprotein-releasing system ATP-binding protein